LCLPYLVFIFSTRISRTMSPWNVPLSRDVRPF
jgi:hypothetical protein